MELFVDKTVHEQGARKRAIDVVAVEINADSVKKSTLEIKMVMYLFNC